MDEETQAGDEVPPRRHPNPKQDQDVCDRELQRLQQRDRRVQQTRRRSRPRPSESRRARAPPRSDGAARGGRAAARSPAHTAGTIP